MNLLASPVVCARPEDMYIYICPNDLETDPEERSHAANANAGIRSYEPHGRASMASIDTQQEEVGLKIGTRAGSVDEGEALFIAVYLTESGVGSSLQQNIGRLQVE
jgi:hypothetical protein